MKERDAYINNKTILYSYSYGDRSGAGQNGLPAREKREKKRALFHRITMKNTHTHKHIFVALSQIL